MQKYRHMSKVLDIMFCYVDGYHNYFSGRELAKKLKISPQTALNHLKGLVKDKILSTDVRGKSIFYSLNLSNFATLTLLKITEDYFSYSALRNFELNSIISKFMPFTDTIIVFGSFVLGKQKEGSDLDLIIVGSSKKELINKEKKIFPREINIEYISWADFRKVLKNKNHLSVEIKKNHLIYGNTQKVVEIYSE
jgi:predicted nucleotidyltransferase